MTVCIAAICTWAHVPPLLPQLIVVGSSDRLITVGDIEFEPFQQKIYQFSTSIIALIAGDAQAQISICDATRARFLPEAPPSVEDVANAYAEELAYYRRKHAEFTYLQPLGLDQESFIARQNELSPSVINQLTYDLQAARLEIETIITGTDSTGCHIFVIDDPGAVRCSDSIAFAAIGMGQRHAESTFMFQRYARHWSYPRALLLTYAAKKRAEIAPGIGASTDFFFIGANGFQTIRAEIFKEVSDTYEEMASSVGSAMEKAGQRVDKSIAEIVSSSATPPSPPPQETPPASDTDKKSES
jgi:20S proteasome alpha/beta subunit